MSLIHDALKKNNAQESLEQNLGKGLSQFQQVADASTKKAPLRIIILAVLLLCLLSVIIYLRLKPSTEPDYAASVKTGVGKTHTAKRAIAATNNDIELMKKKSIDAYNMQNYKLAEAQLLSAISINPADPEVFNNLGVVYKKQGNLEKSREFYMKAQGLSQEYPELLNNLAVLEMDEEKFSDAINLLQKALEISPSYPEANFNLAYLYDIKGKKQDAIDYYRRFLKVGGSYSSNIIDEVRSRVMELEK